MSKMQEEMKAGRGMAFGEPAHTLEKGTTASNKIDVQRYLVRLFDVNRRMRGFSGWDAGWTAATVP